MNKSQWEQGEWGWSIRPEGEGLTRVDDVSRGGRVVTRWDVPVMKFQWQAFPETLAHHDVFLSLN